MQICDAIHLRARQTPDKPALIEHGRITSYAYLSDQIRKTAAVLRSLPIRANEPVGVFLRENTRHVITKLAIIQAGAAALTLDRRSKPDTERLLRYFPAQTKVLAEAGHAMPGHVELIPLDEDWDRRVSKHPVETFPDVSADSPALITLTSGSTGDAKAVVSTHRQQMWRYVQKNMYLPAVTPERYLSTLPLTFSAGNNFIFYYLMSGGTVVLYPVLFSASELVESINSLEITSMFLVPTMLERILSERKDSKPLLPKALKLMVGGAPLRGSSKTRCIETLTPNLYCIYAASGAGWIAFADPRDSLSHPESVGRCVSSIEVQIVDESDSIVPAGRTGHVRCRGDTVGPGFFDVIPTTDDSEAYREGFYYPGDLGHLDEQGYLYLDGRASTMLIRGGVNIYPEHIEKVLMEHDAVSEAAVCGVRDPEQGDEVVAIVVRRHESTALELHNFCRKRLGVYHQPRHLLFVEALPRTHTGKLDRKRLISVAEDLLAG